MKKINIAELLKDCPKGMELDCTICNNRVILEGVVGNGSTYPIRVISKDGFHHMLTCSGGVYDNEDSKCVIFPKGKTTWTGFHRPFKDGDILSYQCTGLRNRTIYIYRHHHTMNTSYYVALGGDFEFMVNHKEGHALSGYNNTARLATEDEKAKLFQAIKDKGYRWNAETKTLEKLIQPKFKVGDKAFAFGNKCTIIDAVWDEGIDEVVYTIKLDTSKYTTTKLSNQLQPYKEETMEDYLVTEEDYGKTLEVEQEYMNTAERLMDQLAEGTHWKCKDFDSQKMIALFLKKNTSIITEKEDSIIVDIPKGYEFAGVDDDKQQVVFEKIGYQYPKTYEECCGVLEDNFLNVICLSDDEKDLFYNIIKIKRCRDAYWRIYGEQMGSGKPWEPDFLDDEQLKFCIYKSHNNILPGVVCKTDEFLVFPTEEMRDAFDENFKELINKCKELL